jgi:hypothetical protein
VDALCGSLSGQQSHDEAVLSVPAACEADHHHAATAGACKPVIRQSVAAVGALVLRWGRPPSPRVHALVVHSQVSRHVIDRLLVFLRVQPSGLGRLLCITLYLSVRARLQFFGIPLVAVARLPLRSADVAELVAAPTSASRAHQHAEKGDVLYMYVFT